MTDLFGDYRSQTTRGLQQISSTKYPDTNKDFQKNIQRLNQFVDYISQYLQTMQKGVDQASQDPISKLRSTFTDLAVLLGGGELLYGINLGDLQYFLPALGAMFGFDSAQPFPLNLLYAAEHFFLGYIIPLDSWAPAVEDIIDAWAVAFGIPADFITALHDVLDALQSITSDYLGLFNALWGILTIFNTLPGIDQGPFGDLWHSISTLLGGINLASLGSLSDPIFHGLAPWIEELAALLSDFDQILQAFTGGVVDITGLINLGDMFMPYINLLSGYTTPLAAWTSVFTNALTAAAVPNLDASKIVSGVLAAARLQPLIDAISQGFGGTTGLNFTSLQSLISGIPGVQALIDTLYQWLTSTSTTGHTLPQLVTALAAFPATLIQGVLNGSAIPNFDASKIISGIIASARVPWAASIDTLMNAWGTTGSGFTLTNLAAKAAAIPPGNVVGQVSANIGTDISQLITAVTTGAGNATIPGTLANLAAQLNGITSLLGYQPAADPPASSTSGIALTQAAFTAMRSATRPTFLALADSTGDVTFPFPLVGTSATTIPVTQAVPAIGSIGTTDGGVAGTDPTTWPLKKSISYVCSKSGTVNGIYLTIYRVNTLTGATTWVHTSPNQAAGVSGGMARYYYNMTNVADYVPVGQNEYYQIGMSIVGPGTINLVGIPNSYAPANTVGFPTHIGATRTPPNLYSVTSSSAATSKNPSFTLTTVTNDNCVLVDAVGYSNVSAITAMTATFGGVAMTQKKFQAFTTIATDAQSAVVAQFELHNAAFAAFTAGAKTIVITTTGGGTSGTQCAVQAQATSYQNISAVDAGTATTGNSASPAQTVTGLTADSPVILHSLLANAIDNWTTGNQNIIANINGVTVTEPLLVQDQFAYATSVPFTGTPASGTGKWGASVVQLTSTLANLVAPVGGVAAPGFTPSSNLPWFMFGGATGVSGAAVATHQPTLQTFTSTGVYHRKSWAKFYDIITCSGAGGGANGSSLVGGYPGAAGIWNTETVTAADVAGDANWDVIVGNGGFGGSGGTSAGASGFAGGDSYVDIGGYGIAAYTPGGVGGTTNNGTVAGSPGGGPGDITVNDEPYYGGSGGASAQASGTQPGGSGAGGNAVFSGNNIYGGNGADGIVYILARQ